MNNVLTRLIFRHRRRRVTDIVKKRFEFDYTSQPVVLKQDSSLRFTETFLVVPSAESLFSFTNRPPNSSLLVVIQLDNTAPPLQEDQPNPNAPRANEFASRSFLITIETDATNTDWQWPMQFTYFKVSYRIKFKSLTGQETPFSERVFDTHFTETGGPNFHPYGGSKTIDQPLANVAFLLLDGLSGRYDFVVEGFGNPDVTVSSVDASDPFQYSSVATMQDRIQCLFFYIYTNPDGSPGDFDILDITSHTLDQKRIKGRYPITRLTPPTDPTELNLYHQLDAGTYFFMLIVQSGNSIGTNFGSTKQSVFSITYDASGPIVEPAFDFDGEVPFIWGSPINSLLEGPLRELIPFSAVDVFEDVGVDDDTTGKKFYILVITANNHV